MRPIFDKIDTHRIFIDYPLPEEYQNQFTNIRIIQRLSDYSFSIVAVNPKLPPLRFDTEVKEWKKQEFGLLNE